MQQPEFLTFDCTRLTVDFLTENERLSFFIYHQTVHLESSRLSRSGNSSSEAHHVLLITIWIAHHQGPIASDYGTRNRLPFSPGKEINGRWAKKLYFQFYLGDN